MSVASIAKFKSAATKPPRGFPAITGAWRAPVRKHFTPFGDLECITIQVKVFHGTGEHDFIAKFNPGCHSGKQICSAIAIKERLNEAESKVFSLWIVANDLGILCS